MFRPAESISQLKLLDAPPNWFGVALWFPKNCDFINLAAPATIDRLEKCGLRSSELAVLEVAAVLTYARSMEPALAANHIVLVRSRRGYLKTLIVNRQYVVDSEDVELEDTVLHESLHLAEDEPAIRSGGMTRGSEDYRRTEDRIDSVVKGRLGRKYGATVDAIAARSLLYAYDLQSKTRTVSSGVFEYWLQRFVLDHYEQLRGYAANMTQEMEKGRHAEVVAQDLAMVRQQYWKLFGYQLPNIE